MSTDDADSIESSAVPSELVNMVWGDVSNRISVIESLRDGQNLPPEMDAYLAGYIDAHSNFKTELKTLMTVMKQFDEELREYRPPTCYNCGSQLGDEWQTRNENAKDNDEHPADCVTCGENPLPPVGESRTE